MVTVVLYASSSPLSCGHRVYPPRRNSIWMKLAILSAAVFAISHAPAHAQSTLCTPDPVNGGSDCVSQVNFQQFAQTAYQTQQLPEWCWAASISMVWAFHGHPVSQSEIVSGTFGALLNMGAQPYQIFQALNGQRVDDNGVSFVSTVTGLYDAQSGFDNLSYTQVGAALDQNQPVLIGTVNPDGSSAHAVVLTAVEYYVPAGYPIEVSADGSNIIQGGVFDPWPGNGARTMTAQQLAPAGRGGSMFFAALVSVSTVPAPPAPGSGGGTNSTHGGGSFDLLSLLGLVGLLALRSRRYFGPAHLE
jgi:hypothetical protein